MQHDAVTLYCPNDLCQAVNPKNYKFCQRCCSPLIKRYLWAVGEGLAACKLEELVRDRYLLMSQQVLLDTKPGLLPELPTSEISAIIKPYLKLVSYRIHVPQVYGVLPLSSGPTVVLLEQAAIYTEAVPLEGQVMPELVGVWQDGTSMRQLNWLWQIAQLWQPFSSEGVASTLLEPELLRVEGPLVRLLELRLDQELAPTLASLGQLWKTHLLPGTQSAIASFLQQVCQQLIEGDIHSSEQLLALLDHGLSEVGRSQAHVFTIATRSDTGPSRQRNEDACYPASGTTITLGHETGKALAIVCDGIGGHEGGDVASNLAIETVQQQVQPLTLDSAYPDAITLQLERSACAANDRISQRNDRENRQGRQRMGTTLVMALAHAYEIYVTHVGDSRAYWITRTGCHQITLDDDVASREVRLGYALYRDALQQVSAGSLIQALGMSSSTALRPTVQRFILDEDCVFLLCSDGLSDYDRVEQCWETEILPILDGKVDLATAGTRLVEIGNSQNGHDNVTVCLLYCQVSSFEPELTVSASPAPQHVAVPDLAVGAKTMVMDGIAKPDTAPSKLKTQLLPHSAPRRRFGLVSVGILVLILFSGLLAYLFRLEFNRWISPLIGFGLSSSPSIKPNATNSASPLVPIPSSSSLPFETVSLSRVNTNNSSTPGKILLLRQEKPNKNQRIIGFIPSGSVLHIIQDQTLSEKNRWLQVKVCSTPKATSAYKPQQGRNDHSPTGKQASQPPLHKHAPPPKSYLPVPPGEQGWIKQTEIAGFIEASGSGNCSASTPASQPTASPTEGVLPKPSTGTLTP